MDTETMRRILAERAMGWEFNVASRYWKWREANGARVSMHKSQWQPDRNWQQCGLVIEAMRERGWTWHVTAFADGSTTVRLRSNGAVTGECWAVDERLPEREARMLAAARALEANDGEP